MDILASKVRFYEACECYAGMPDALGELAAYLKISTGYWERKLKEEDELTQMVERMKEKTEALRQQNQEERAKRQYRNIHNLDHYGRPRI